MQKILVLRGGALGDLIVTLPALAALRRRWPTTWIELAGNINASILALDTHLIDVAHSQHEARWSSLFNPEPLPTKFASWLRAFDLVLNYWPDPDGVLAGHFPEKSAPCFLSASAQPEEAPAAAHFCAPLRTLGIKPDSFMFQLRARSVSRAEKLRIAVHPGSGSARKNWPVSRWKDLCAWLRDTLGASLLIVTGEAEPEDARALAGFGCAAHQLPLLTLSNELASCHLFVGHDSGISHLAAACGVPCVLLFGPTIPSLWAPPTSFVRVLKSGTSLAVITLAEVQHAVAECLKK